MLNFVKNVMGQNDDCELKISQCEIKYRKSIHNKKHKH